MIRCELPGQNQQSGEMPLLTLAEFNDMSGHEERTAQLNALRCKDFGLNSSGQMMQLLSLASVGPAPQDHHG